MWGTGNKVVEKKNVVKRLGLVAWTVFVVLGWCGVGCLVWPVREEGRRNIAIIITYSSQRLRDEYKIYIPLGTGGSMCRGRMKASSGNKHDKKHLAVRRRLSFITYSSCPAVLVFPTATLWCSPKCITTLEWFYNKFTSQSEHSYPPCARLEAGTGLGGF